MFSSSSLLCSNKPVLIPPFTLNFSTEDRRLLKETGNQNLTPTAPLGSQIHIYLTQQKTPECFQVSLSCSYLSWRYSSEHVGGSSDIQLSVAPPALPTLLKGRSHGCSFLYSNHLCHHELPNPNLQEMSNQRSPFCDFCWCFHHARTFSLAKMVLLLST